MTKRTLGRVKVSRKQVEKILNATFPDYKGRLVFIEPVESVTLHDLNWSGGSRSQYRTCTLDGQPVGSADRYNQMHPMNHQAESAKIPMLPDVLIVRHSIFCGKDVGIDIYVHPNSQLGAMVAAVIAGRRPKELTAPPSFLS
jgi:hypothetical protein